MARVTGWVMLVAILLAPATRVGYLLYPINLFLWAWMFRRSDDPADAVGAPSRRRLRTPVSCRRGSRTPRSSTAWTRSGVVGETTTPTSQ